MLLLLLVVLCCCWWGTTGVCTVCRDGRPVPNPNTNFSVQGIPVENCASLETTATFLSAESEFCESIQSIGTLCGCEIPNGACILCPNDVSEPDRELPGYEAAAFLMGAPPGVLLTCDILQAVLHSYPSDDALCASSQTNAGPTCGCGGPTMNNTNTTTPPIVLPPTPSPEAGNGQPCNVCSTGDPIALPNKTLNLGDLPVNSCADLQVFANLLDGASTECLSIHSLGPLCGCPRPEYACTFCPHGEPVPKPDRKLNWFSSFVTDIPDALASVGESLTCELMEAIVVDPRPEVFGLDPDLICIAAHLKSSVCGCRPGWKAILLTWCYRGSGIISFLGSLLIILDILKKRHKRKTTYHQLILGISVCDCISSTAYILVGVMAPVEAGFYKSLGNDTTCKAQGFLIQLGFTSVFYNLCLSLYFWLVVVHNWKERRLQSYLVGVHCLVAATGMSLAVAGLWHYGPQYGICYILQPPASSSWLATWVFFGAPVSVVLTAITIASLSICIKVYRTQKASSKYAARKNMALSRKVFWQSLLFVLAFDFTMPFLLLSYFLRFETRGHYWIFVVVGVLSPSQGIFNALAYFQRSTKSPTEILASALYLRQAGTGIKRLSVLVRENLRRTSVASSLVRGKASHLSSENEHTRASDDHTDHNGIKTGNHRHHLKEMILEVMEEEEKAEDGASSMDPWVKGQVTATHDEQDEIDQWPLPSDAQQEEGRKEEHQRAVSSEEFLPTRDRPVNHKARRRSTSYLKHLHIVHVSEASLEDNYHDEVPNDEEEEVIPDPGTDTSAQGDGALGESSAAFGAITEHWKIIADDDGEESEEWVRRKGPPTTVYTTSRRSTSYDPSRVRSRPSISVLRMLSNRFRSQRENNHPTIPGDGATEDCESSPRILSRFRRTTSRESTEGKRNDVATHTEEQHEDEPPPPPPPRWSPAIISSIRIKRMMVSKLRLTSSNTRMSNRSSDEEDAKT